MGELIQIRTAREARVLLGGAHRLERAARRGDLTRLRSGAYADSDNLVGVSEEALHLARVAASRLAAIREPVFSHESAAALLGIPLIGDWPERARTTVPKNGTKSSGSVQRTRRTLGPHEIVTLEDGTRVTSPARTAIDLAAGRSLLAGIVAISYVRHAGVPLGDLERAVDELGSGSGVRRTRAAIRRSADRSESALETLVLVRLQDYGFETPELQRPIRGIDGREYRVDFAWQDDRILLDVDGYSKYEAIAAASGRTAAEVVLEEKRREDALRPMCDRFLRLGCSEAWGGHELLRRLAAVGIPRRARCASVLTF